MLNNKKIIAIDGPAGSGKSTICAEIAIKNNWNYVNTGLLYRVLAFLLIENKIELIEEKIIGYISENSEYITWDVNNSSVKYKNRTLGSELRDEVVGLHASKIAGMEDVRELLLPIQRRWVDNVATSVLIDGRDIGTVVFPNADVKIFLTASLEARAKRRFSQIKTLNKNNSNTNSLEKITNEMSLRDKNDSNRKIAPLKPAKEAIIIDTSIMSLSQVVDKISQIIN